MGNHNNKRIAVQCGNPECSKEMLVKPSVFKRSSSKVFCCSKTCSSVDFVVAKVAGARKATNLKVYGSVCSLQNPDIHKKTLNTNLEKYGNTIPQVTERVKAKARTTNLERYGVENGGGSPEALAKIKRTTLARFGVENIFEDNKYIQAAFQRKFGVKGPMQVPEIRAKADKTRKERYSDLQGAVPRKASEKTCLERYGNKNFFGSFKFGNQELRERGWTEEELAELSSRRRITLQTMISRYGEIEGSERYEKWKLAVAPTLANSINKYGEAEGTKKYLINVKKRTVNVTYASKASLPSLEAILARTSNIATYYGYDGHKEWYISRPGGRFFLYDLTFRDQRVIVEYQGSKFHFKESNLGLPSAEDWRCLYSGHTARESADRDRLKRKHAEAAGFTVMYIWEEDSPEEQKASIDAITNLVNQRTKICNY